MKCRDDKDKLAPLRDAPCFEFDYRDQLKASSFESRLMKTQTHGSVAQRHRKNKKIKVHLSRVADNMVMRELLLTSICLRFQVDQIKERN